MYCTKKITETLSWIGVNDRRLALFENVFPIERGVSYNSYLLKDEKTVLFDTVDKTAGEQFLANLKSELSGKTLDYLVINHMEPDHCSMIGDIIEKYPSIKIVCNKMTCDMLKQFFEFNVDDKIIIVKENDSLNTGHHNLVFIMAPMVHWPEAMVTYDTTDKILFSADAFGTFGALSGNIFADEVNFEQEWLDDARRYYTNIVGKYGTQVQALLKKAATLDIKMICPLHGPVWRENINYFIKKYHQWSTYTPEDNGVLILYGSIYGHTQNAAEILATKLADLGVTNIKLYDVSKTHFSYLLAEAFRCSHIVIATATYNAGIFCNMQNLLLQLKEHNLQNRKIAILQNGTWAPTAAKLTEEIFSQMKNIEIIQPIITVKSSVKNNQLDELDKLAQNIFTTIPKKELINPMFKINYGLYLLTSKNGDKDNGCIINTLNQITDTPNRIAISLSKTNYTHNIIEKAGIFNISVLTKQTPFKVFEQFGFFSGKNMDKFLNFDIVSKSKNGIYYLNKYANAVISAKVTSKIDFGSHTLFIANVEEIQNLNNDESITYTYYLKNIKPEPKKCNGINKGYICKICNYVYEGEILPSDFICPLCKHGIADFEKICSS